MQKVLVLVCLLISLRGVESDTHKDDTHRDDMHSNVSVSTLEGVNFHDYIWDMKMETEGNALVLIAGHELWRLDTDTKKKQLVAGSPSWGYIEGVGEGARFNNPRGLAVIGNKVIVCDGYNHCIREVDLISHRTSHLAGTCQRRGYRDGPAGQAQFKFAYGLLGLKSGVLVSDRYNNAVRLVEGGMVSTIVAGSETAPVWRPEYLTRMGDQIFLTTNSALLKLDLDSKSVELIAGQKSTRMFSDGPLLEAQFDAALGVISPAPGLILIADYYNHRVRRVDLISKKVSSICTGIEGNVAGAEDECQLNLPWSIAIVGESIYIGQSNGRIKTMPLQAFTG